MTAVVAQRASMVRKSPGPAQWRIFGLAILIHLALLLVPIAHESSVPRRPLLEIELRPAPSPAREQSHPAQPSAQAIEDTSPAATAVDRPAPADQDPVHVPSQETDAEPVISAALLLEQAMQMNYPRKANADARLGRSSPRGHASLQLQPILPPVTTVFEDFYLPAENEIVDQWQDRNGTRHVVMRTPSGHTLCGRLDAWDPHNPLFEPVPMYRRCAGGGKRN
ncbi:MAG: hypothetical protein HKO64_01510 [Xanthomonadales bacterium]|nr:hypothetical protein [Xanthomonadales bacterium]